MIAHSLSTGGPVAQHQIDPDGLPYALDKLPRKEPVGADGFFALDLRVGRVTDVQDFPDARKPAWKLTVDFGPAVGTLRTSAQVRNYAVAELVDRLVVGAINLGDKRVAGFTSEFLILGALDPDGAVRLLELPDDVQPGAPVA
ncbi:MAG: tRNA-binding protein [Euzebyales bacterium]|nr:tRNA-binding protein [Euzebyales bacterium]